MKLEIPAADSAILAAFSSYIAFKILTKEPKIKVSSKKLVGHVEELAIFPLKTCRGISLKKAKICKFGLKSGNLIDRFFATRQLNGVKTSAIQNLRLKLIEIKEGANNDEFIFSAPDMTPLVLNLADCSELTTIDFYGDKIVAKDGGDAAAEWFSTYLGEEARLTVNPEGRDVSKTNWIPEKNGPALDWRLKGIDFLKTDNFSNHYPIQLISSDSIDDINSKIPANREKISHWNFRSNIIAKILNNTPWDEDNWIGRLYIGDCIIAMARESLRCPLITVDKEEITVCQDDEPMKTLKTFRKINPKDVPFLAEKKLCKIPAGTDYVIVKEGEIRVGDPIYLEQLA